MGLLGGGGEDRAESSRRAWTGRLHTRPSTADTASLLRVSTTGRRATTGGGRRNALKDADRASQGADEPRAAPRRGEGDE